MNQIELGKYFRTVHSECALRKCSLAVFFENALWMCALVIDFYRIWLNKTLPFSSRALTLYKSQYRFFEIQAETWDFSYNNSIAKIKTDCLSVLTLFICTYVCTLKVHYESALCLYTFKLNSESRRTFRNCPLKVHSQWAL